MGGDGLWLEGSKRPWRDGASCWAGGWVEGIGVYIPWGDPLPTFKNLWCLCLSSVTWAWDSSPECALSAQLPEAAIPSHDAPRVLCLRSLTAPWPSSSPLPRCSHPCLPVWGWGFSFSHWATSTGIHVCQDFGNTDVNQISKPESLEILNLSSK